MHTRKPKYHFHRGRFVADEDLTGQGLVCKALKLIGICIWFGYDERAAAGWKVDIETEDGEVHRVGASSVEIVCDHECVECANATVS